MSNVNDNNLDDLLRRAAEKYPLRTDSADFSKVVADLERDPSLILPPLNTEDRRRRRRFFWLFLLLPLAGGAYFVWHAGVRSKGSAQATTQTKITDNGAPAIAAGEDGIGTLATNTSASGTSTAKTPVSGKPTNGAPVAGTSKTGTSVTGAPKAGTPTSGTPTTRTPRTETSRTETSRTETSTTGTQTSRVSTRTPTDRTPVTAEAKTTTAKTFIPKSAYPENSHAKNVLQKNVIPENGTTTGGKAKNQYPIQSQQAKTKSTQSDLDNAVVIGHQAAGRDRSGLGSRIPMAPTKGPVDVNIPVSDKTLQSSVKIDQSSGKTDQASARTDQTTKKDALAKAKNIRLQKPKHSFYVGILGSPDLSTIKFQSVKSVGDNIGVLFGYTLSSRWSIETGLFYDRKKYYTNGEYFSKSKLPQVMQDVDLKKVDGGCNMWEIPLNVRYNFRSANAKMQWFATAGFSTYLMSKESYTFWGTYWGNPDWHKTYPYDTPYKYWFSILNLSAGFEQPLGKIGNLRLEPFVRVPLSGVGTGSLSIMSAGLNIGITRKLW